MSKRIGLPVTLKMRHDAHYVESLTSYSGAAVGRMIPVERIRPNPDQPRKALGDLRELSDSIREKGVLEPLLVRFVAREDCFYIISGERRYHASRAAGLREVPCIEKTADDAETLEIGLIENLQRKDLTPFEEADGLERLGTQFEYSHDDIARYCATKMRFPNVPWRHAIRTASRASRRHADQVEPHERDPARAVSVGQ